MGIPTGEFHAGEHRGEHGVRAYRVYRPGDPGPGRPPLVVLLHGCTQDAADFARGTRGSAAADRTGAVVVYPEQPATANPQKCWNWFDPAHQARDAGEPAILAGMTRELVREMDADPDRVFVAGISAGGSMAQILAANYPDLFRGLAVHSAPPFRSAHDVASALDVLQNGVPDAAGLAAAVVSAMGRRARPVRTLVIHGEADPVVRVVNAEQVHAQWATLADVLGRTPVPVDLWIIPGLAHAWAGGSSDGTWTDPSAPDATRRIFEFLLEPVASP